MRTTRRSATHRGAVPFPTVHRVQWVFVRIGTRVPIFALHSPLVKSGRPDRVVVFGDILGDIHSNAQGWCLVCHGPSFGLLRAGCTALLSRTRVRCLIPLRLADAAIRTGHRAWQVC